MYEDVKQQFKEVIEYSQNIEASEVDELFDKWYEAKSEFIEDFGGKLIYEVPEEVSFTISDKEKNKRIEDFVSIIESRYKNYELIEFIEAMKPSFYKNITDIPYKMSDGTVIPKGMKLIKAFKFFEKNKNVLYDIQNEASRIL